MKLGINSVFPHETAEQWASILHEKGFETTAFPVNYEAKDSVIESYIKAFKDYNISIAEVGIWNSPFVPDSKTAEHNKEVCVHQLELADYLKANCCVNVSGAFGECWYGCYPENYTQEAYSKNIQFIQYLLDTVKPKHTFYTLEMMQWMIPDSAESNLQLLKDVNREHFAVHLDPVNLVNNPKIAMTYAEYLDHTIDLLAPYIKSCHVKDFDIKQELTVQIYETIPGTGRADLARYVQRMDAINPNMPMIIEHLKDWSEYDQAIKYMKQFSKND